MLCGGCGSRFAVIIRKSASAATQPGIQVLATPGSRPPCAHCRGTAAALESAAIAEKWSGDR